MTKTTVEVEEALNTPGWFTVYRVGKYDKDHQNYTIEREMDSGWRTDKAAVQADVDLRNFVLVGQWRAKHQIKLAAYEIEKAEWQALKDAGLREGEWNRNPPTLSGGSRYKPELPWDHYILMELEIKIG